MYRYIAILAFLCLSGITSAQTVINGIVRDSKTKEALPFVNILEEGTRNGTTTDIDGKFKLKTRGSSPQLTFSYVGYEQITLPASTERSMEIMLRRKSVSLEAVNVFPGENPAHRIIRRTYANRNLNNPEKNGSFEYDTYMKMKGIIHMDNKELIKQEAEDTTLLRFLEFLELSDLFLIETITHRKFTPPNLSKETILGTKVSGFQNPDFGLLTSQMGSFTFYDETFVFGNREYLNPISKNSEKKYLFILEDSTFNTNDTTYIISFRPRKNKKFDGLTGLLYINTNGYAVQHVTAEPTAYQKGVNVKLQQSYELVDNKKWFPSEIQTDLMMLVDSSLSKMEFEATLRGFFLNIELDPVIKKKEFNHLAADIDPLAARRPDSFWNEFRVDTLTLREKTTYHKIDSVSKKLKLEKKLYFINGLISGVAPVSIIDFDLDKIIRFNRYEGIGLGLGIHTNHKLSRHFSVGGYFNYGFEDKTWKYGGDLAIKPIKGNEWAFKFSAIKDVAAVGGTEWYIKQRKTLTNSFYRPAFVNLKDNRERLQAGILFRSFRSVLFYPFINYDRRWTTDNNLYVSETGDLGQYFENAEVGVELRYAHGEKYLPVNDKLFSLGTKAPILHLKYSRGLQGIEQSQFSYNRIDAKLLKQFNWRSLGKTQLALTGGFIDATLPRTFLFNAPAAFYEKLPIQADQAFQTMRANEFFADQYAHLFFKHYFRKMVAVKGFVEPVITLYHNMGIGVLGDENKLANPSLRDYTRGYFESGIGVDNLIVSNFSGIGLAVFYRYGDPELPLGWDNFAIKLTTHFNFIVGSSTALE